MKLKFIVAGLMLAASFGASATSYSFGTLDPTGPDGGTITTGKFGAGAIINDTWSFTLDTTSATSLGAQQNFVSNGAFKNFAGELFEGSTDLGALTLSTAGTGQQDLSWSGQLGSGDYSVHITGLTTLKNGYYTASISALPVPEPETYGMLLGGLALLGVVARRKGNKA